LESGVQKEQTMQEDHQDLDAIFGEALNFISGYSRAQALADGVLVDVSEVAKEAGFRVPVALTTGVWERAVAWSAADTARQTPQDESGRLWDVLWMAYVAARRASGGCQVPYQLHVVPRGGRATRARLLTLHMQIGPGDDGEAVITITLPGED
jgi:hypothetical protein